MPKNSDSPSIHVLSVGPFGDAVSRHLRRLHRDVVDVTPDDLFSNGDAVSTSRINVLVAWRPVQRLCQAMDEISHRWNTPFIPVIADSMILRVGPVIVPGKGGCWNCWTKRSKQHPAWTEDRSSLLNYYDSHPQEGPKGYLEPFAVMACAQTSGVIDTLDHSGVLPGQIWQIDMVTLRVTTSKLVGVHDCARCGLHRPVTTRSFEELRDKVSYLWAKSVVNEH
jgi:bacteriocin biosynthesis cyclodehydratase domain-containing protein